MFAEKRSALITEIALCRDRSPRCRRRAGRRRKRDGRDRPRSQGLARSAVERARGLRPRRGAREGASAGWPMSSAKSTTCSKSSRAVAGLAELEQGAELPPLDEIEENLDKLRRERERLGAVNLRAEEELREVEAQHATLTTERDDLVEAISGCARASRASTARHASGCWPRSRSSTATSSGCSPSCSAAARRNCS